MQQQQQQRQDGHHWTVLLMPACISQGCWETTAGAAAHRPFWCTQGEQPLLVLLFDLFLFVSTGRGVPDRWMKGQQLKQHPAMPGMSCDEAPTPAATVS